MIDHQRGQIVFECDACGDTLDTDTREFDEANALRREEGWLAEKVGRDWVHFCSDRCKRGAR